MRIVRRSQGPRGPRRKSAAARLRLWVRIPPGAWMFVCCDCCVLSGRGLCDGLITHPEESYRLWFAVVCDLETSSRMRRSWPAFGCSAIGRGGGGNFAQRKSASVRSLIICRSIYSVEEHLVFAEGDQIFKVQKAAIEMVKRIGYLQHE